MDYFLMSLDDLFPSQLYLNRDKINALLSQIHPYVLKNIPPISIRRFNDRVVMLDGHTRGYLAHLHKIPQVPVYWETEEYDWEAYAICIKWCEEAGITHVSKLHNRIVENQAYQQLWIGRCQAIFPSDE